MCSRALYWLAMSTRLESIRLDGAALNITTSRLGTYGQFGLGTAAAIINTGWLGYARVDYKTGEDIEGWNFNAGLRYQFTPEQRGSVKDGFGPAVYAYNWTGPYIGLSVGAIAWGHEDWTFTSNNATVDGLGYAGALVGGQIGYNLQVGQHSVWHRSRLRMDQRPRWLCLARMHSSLPAK